MQMMITGLEVKGNSGTTYKIKTTPNGGLHCTCPAWQFQAGKDADHRTCKHIEFVRSRLRTGANA